MLKPCNQNLHGFILFEFMSLNIFGEIMTPPFFKPTLLMMQKAFPGKSQILRNFPGS
jgi:hypothetical protein